MTVAENVFLGSEPKRRGLIDWDKMLVQAKQLLDKFGLHHGPIVPRGAKPLDGRDRALDHGRARAGNAGAGR